MASIFVSIFSCKPVEAFWTGDGTCVELRGVVSFVGAYEGEY